MRDRDKKSNHAASCRTLPDVRRQSLGYRQAIRRHRAPPPNSADNSCHGRYECSYTPLLSPLPVSRPHRGVICKISEKVCPTGPPQNQQRCRGRLPKVISHFCVKIGRSANKSAVQQTMWERQKMEDGFSASVTGEPKRKTARKGASPLQDRCPVILRFLTRAMRSWGHQTD